MRILSAACVLASVLYAQTPAGTVVGRVTDATGAVMPGVTIKIVNLDTNLASDAATNEVGDYTVPYLNPGRYTLEARMEGFKAYKQAEFQIAVDQVLRLNIAMEVGATADSVTVTEAPPVLTTDSGARGAVTTKEEISEIPLEGRNFSDLAYLTGGVIPKGDGGDGAYAINGARADNVGFVIDGMNNTQRRNTGAVINPPIEGVQEFKMITSGFSAEYGRYAGGVLSVVMKSGTNRLHGSLYEFIRNDYWDARSFFDVNKSKLRRNQFGATVSGPVFLPKLYDGREKTFFMATWESLRLIDGKTQRGIVPQPEMLRGDFSKATDAFGRPINVIDYTNGRTPFPNKQIPVSRLDPVSLKMAQFYPSPNLAGVNNYIAYGNATGSYNNIGIKVDHNLTAMDRLGFSTFWRPNRSTDPVVNSRSPFPIFGLANQTLDLLSGVKYLKGITSTMFLEVTASFSRKTNNQAWPLSGERDWANEVGFRGGTNNPIAAGLPQFEASGYLMLGPAYDYPKIWAFNNYQYIANTTWIKGKHNVKFGFDYLRMQYFSRGYGDTRGRMTFLGRFTGEPMADMLMGWAQTSRRQLDASGPYHLVSNYAGYVQDDFKVSSTLTLNLGVRYELMKPPREKFGAWSMFVPSLGKIVIAGRGTVPDFDRRIAESGVPQYVAMAKDVGLPATIVKPDYTDFGPRFGFAWRPLGKTSVIRGGYGIFYGSSSLYRMDEYSDTYPFSINESYTATSNNPLLLTVSDPFPEAKRRVGGLTSTSGQEPSRQSQYLQSWNLTYEREFAKETVLEVAYAGSKGTHLPRRFDGNQAIRDLDYRAQFGTFPRPYAGFNTINIINDGSNSIYNSGAVTIRRRFSRQLFVRASYTYAKSIDESSNMGGTIQYNFPAAQDARNLSLERGRSDFDIGHSFAASFILSPKFSRNVMLRNWQISGTSTIYTGPPFTPKVANFSYENGEASRPDRIGVGRLETRTADQWFDRTVFPVVPVGSFRFGNSGRNILDGPGTFNVNTSLSRRFKFGEAKAFQARFEAFNLPNHTNFNLPENRVDIISGGSINRAKNNRIFQAGLRMEF